MEFTIIESYHGQKLYYHWINLLNFNWHYNMIILVNRTLIIYVSAWWRICCQGLLCFSIISLSSFAFCSASSAFDPLIKTITIKNIQIKMTVFRDHWRLLSTDVTKFEKITLRGILPTNNVHPPLQTKNCPLGCVNIAYSQKSKNLGFLSYST